MIYGIPNFKLEKRRPAPRDLLRTPGDVRAQCEVGRDVTLAELRAAPRRGADRHRRLKARDIAAPGVGLAGIVPALDYLTASNRNGLGDNVPAFDGRAERDRQERRGHRRRRHGDGLRAHGGAPGREVGQLPLSPRSRQHAGLAARGAACRGGGRRVRLALRARGFPRQGQGRRVRAARMHLGVADATGRQTPQASTAATSISRPTW